MMCAERDPEDLTANTPEDYLRAFHLYSMLWGGDGATTANAIAHRLWELGYENLNEDLALAPARVKRLYGRLEMRHHGPMVAYFRWQRRHPDVFPPWPGRGYFARPETCEHDFVVSEGLDPRCLDVWKDPTLGPPGEDHTPDYAKHLCRPRAA